MAWDLSLHKCRCPYTKNLNDKKPFDIITTNYPPKRTVAVGRITFKPYHYDPDILNTDPYRLRVLAGTKTYFKVINNEETGEAYYIRRNPKADLFTTRAQFKAAWGAGKQNKNPLYYIYETWENYLLRLEGVQKDPMILYDQPKGGIINSRKGIGSYIWRVKAVKGDWIKVEKISFSGQAEEYLAGWTQWKQGGHMLLTTIIEYHDE